MTQFGGLKAVGRKFSRSLKVALEVQKVLLLYLGRGVLEKQRKKERLRLIQEGVNRINALGKNDFAPQHEMEGRNVRRGEDCATCTQAD